MKKIAANRNYRIKKRADEGLQQMMYVVIAQTSYDGDVILGVYDSKTRAEVEINAAYENNQDTQVWEIRELPLNPSLLEDESKYIDLSQEAIDTYNRLLGKRQEREAKDRGGHD